MSDAELVKVLRDANADLRRQLREQKSEAHAEIIRIAADIAKAQRKLASKYALLNHHLAKIGLAP